MDMLPILYVAIQNDRIMARQRRRRQRRRPRVFRPRVSFADFTDAEVYQQFRLDRASILSLYEKLEVAIGAKTGRSHAVPGLTKMVSAIYYMANASFQHCIAERFGFSQPTFSRFFHEVVDELFKLCTQYIAFPKTADAIRRTQAEFVQVAGMPNVIGLIDCTHVALVPPAADEYRYRNRKMFRSINVQVTVDHNNLITNVVAKYPGSTHDSFIFEHCGLNRRLQSELYRDAFLLGDNGYKLLPWLMTPYLRPSTPKERSFNHAHRRTRSAIERTFGILKSRFRCLDFSGGAMLYKPPIVCKVIIACCMLHNIATANRLEIDLATDLTEHIEHQGDVSAEPTNRAGQLRRRQITEIYF
ncbi:putative nuclease HARBI1 [Engystomops pustulosus]|uniref:putative nuclease HARBI1 n=1 Tax=Engystomops pustulosus TaxID=76066 RepID=UPI003AFB7A8C